MGKSAGEKEGRAQGIDATSAALSEGVEKTMLETSEKFSHLAGQRWQQAIESFEKGQEAQKQLRARKPGAMTDPAYSAHHVIECTKRIIDIAETREFLGAARAMAGGLDEQMGERIRELLEERQERARQAFLEEVEMLPKWTLTTIDDGSGNSAFLQGALLSSIYSTKKKTGD